MTERGDPWERFIILVRNPHNNKLMAITADGDGDEIAEFETEEDATEAADRIPICRSWGFEVVEVSGV